MPKIEFVLLTNQAIDKLPTKALEFLSKAVEKTNSNFSVDAAIQQFYQGLGYIYTAYYNDRIIGCFFINFSLVSGGKILSIILMGGENTQLWFEDIEDFFSNLAKQCECFKLTLMGRRGWGKIYPSLKEEAVLYSKNLT